MLVIGPHPTSHAGDDITMQTLVTRVVRGLVLLECTLTQGGSTYKPEPSNGEHKNDMSHQKFKGFTSSAGAHSNNNDAGPVFFCSRGPTRDSFARAQPCPLTSLPH